MKKLKFTFIYLSISFFLIFMYGGMIKILDYAFKDIVKQFSVSSDVLAILSMMAYLGSAIIGAICILMIGIFFVNYIKLIKNID